METPRHTIKEARTIGSRKALKCTLFVFLTLEAFILFLETRGDFANGIMFFIQGQKDSLFLSMIFILFLSSFFLGRWAGRKILVEKKNHILIAMLLALLTAGILISYFYLFAIIKRLITGDWKILTITISLVSLSIWIITTWSIGKMRPE